ncbi:hypothetical protein FO519_003219 [Halicephalobus sp. NKZ332]|nr:hypothetical protein FO519_003219 [Halicephalobus sp. NKZ332]
MTKALVVAFPDAEDIELTTTVDVLRRGGIEVTVANLLNENTFKCARGTVITADALFIDVEEHDFDAVIVPGGPGSMKVAENDHLGKILRRHEAAEKIVAAICAAPYIFTVHGIGKEGQITSYPSVKEKIVAAHYDYVETDPVVVSNNVVTSRGPGTAMDFGLKLVEMLTDKDTSQKVADSMLYKIRI